jgi:pimeloyl-ACP methyl ester carboxylesterase
MWGNRLLTQLLPSAGEHMLRKVSEPPVDHETPAADHETPAEVTPPPDTRTWRARIRWAVKWTALVAAVLVVLLTVASFSYNLATDGPAPRPSGLLMVSGGGFDTRYRTWGTTGSPIVLVPGAFETADTYAALGAALGTDHRVFAIDLTGTGYSTPSPPFDASHMAAQVLAFLTAEGLTGANAPILVGHSSGAAVVGLAALHGPSVVRGVVFLDGDATPLGAGPQILGWLLIDPYRTTILRLALGSDWLIRQLYGSQCGPSCPPLSAAGVKTWRLPLEQPGFESEVVYSLRHGIPSMTSQQFSALRAVAVPKRVIFGTGDSQISASDAASTAARIGAPAPISVPGRHLTMIASPQQVATALRQFVASLAAGGG